MPPSPEPSPVPSGWRDWKGSPKDVARWLFWVQLRAAVQPERPELLARFYPLWRAQYEVARGQRALMADEYRRWLGEAPEALVQEAYRIAFRVHLEELLLGKLTRDNWQKWLTLEGAEHLDAALARGKGAILVFPHAGNFMLMHAVMGLMGHAYTQYAARGMAPPEVARAHADVFANNKWRREAREARESNEDRLPIRFISLDTSVRELYRCLARNELVGIAFDGRIGQRWAKVPYLGRTALLNPGPWRLAASTGAALLPTFLECPEGEPNRCRFAEPVVGDDAEELRQRAIGGAIEPWLRANPAHYGIWLAHCRERAAVDDHPFFLDYAPDDRWQRWDGPRGA
jgi:phosphatidylinositol dimannoside acyltransferase